MNKPELMAWAGEVGEHVTAKRDMTLAISSELVRWTWDGVPTMGIGSEVKGKARIDLVLDALAWQRATHPEADELRLVLGVDDVAGAPARFAEAIGAIGTIASAVKGGPTIRLFLRDASGQRERRLAPASFTSDKPAYWAELLAIAAASAPPSLAHELADRVASAAFSIYPKLSTKGKEWQLRLDGLEVGRLAPTGNVLKLNSKDVLQSGKPWKAWLAVVGTTSVDIDAVGVDETARLLRGLADAWTTDPEAPLAHGQPEHALEAHVLTGRLQLRAGETLLSPLRLEAPLLRDAQFPTLWGDVTSPARYLDALLRDTKGRPWAVELKDQWAGGGHGAYLRDGIAQAILYRHYIKSSPAVDAHFESLHLDRLNCQAALAFPTPKLGTEKIMASHRAIADMCDVTLIPFVRPGA